MLTITPQLHHAHTTGACLPLLFCSLEEDEERERGITPVYVKYDARLYGPRKPGQKVRRRHQRLLLLLPEVAGGGGVERKGG